MHKPMMRWRHRAYEILEQGPVGDRSMRITSRLLILLVLVNVAAVVLESVPRYEAAYEGVFTAIEIVSIIVFTLEYGLRIWAAAEHAPYLQITATQARLRYMLSTDGLIDLVSVLPFWLAFVVPFEFRVILLLRVVRFLKLARYSPAMRSLLEALYAERRALFGCVVILIGATLITATFMHLAERDVQPDKFGTIPDAMWWAIVTLGTIGYGDVVPVTPLGKVVAAVTIFCGLVMIALPVGIIATAFAEQIHRRDFVVTWGMVARVPLFAGSTPATIAEIMRLLRAQTVECRATSSCGAATPPIPCISSPLARSEIELDGKRVAPRRRPFLRRDRGAAPGAPLGHRAGATRDQPAGARRHGSARPDGAGAADRRARPHRRA